MLCFMHARAKGRETLNPKPYVFSPKKIYVLLLSSNAKYVLRDPKYNLTKSCESE